LLAQCEILYKAVLSVDPRTATEIMFGESGVRELERLLAMGALDPETAEVSLHRHRERLRSSARYPAIAESERPE